MPTVRFASAVRQTLDAGARGVAEPRDDSVDVVWLDLTRQRPEIASAVLRSVASALVPRMLLQGGARLIVATGAIGPRRAARIVSESIDRARQDSTAIGVVRGESLLDRLEELALAGCGLRETPDGGRLLDEATPPAAVWAATGAGPIVETMAAGAQLVLTQAADLGTIGVAAAAEAFAWSGDALQRYATAAAAVRTAARCGTPWVELSDDASVRFASSPTTFDDEIVLPDLRCTVSGDARSGMRVSSVTSAPTTRRVEATIPIGWRAQSAVRVLSDSAAEELIERIGAIAPREDISISSIESSPNSSEKTVSAACDSIDESTANGFAERLGLLLTISADIEPLVRPIAAAVQRFRDWRTEAPTELLQYGVDVRPASEWLSD